MTLHISTHWKFAAAVFTIIGSVARGQDVRMVVNVKDKSVVITNAVALRDEREAAEQRPHSHEAQRLIQRVLAIQAAVP